MHFDALTLACIRDELRQHLAGGRVQQVLLPDTHSVGLEIYAQRQRHYLLLSAQPGAGRVHLSSDKLRRGVDKETPLLLLLRKYVRGAGLDAIEQPDPFDRILHLRFEHPQHGSTVLVAEPMGRLSNLFLLGPNQKILECVHRVPPGDNAQRVLLPGKPYQPPPVQDKLPPLDDGRDDYYAQLQAIVEQPGKLWRAIVDGIAGASPTLAREIAWRTTGDANSPAQAAEVLALAQTLQTLFAPAVRTRSGDNDGNADWQPGLLREEEQVIGFTAYEAHFRGQFAPTASMSQAVESYFTLQGAEGTRHEQADETLDPYAALRGQIAADLRSARQKLERQLAALAKDEPAPEAPAQMRTQAEWLMALASQVQPNQTILEVDLSGGGEGADGNADSDAVLRIDLDPNKTPIAQAEAMFDRAAKLERAAVAIPKRRAELENMLAYADQLEVDLAMAENQPELAAVREELRDALHAVGMGPGKESRRTSGWRPPASNQATPPMRFVAPDGTEIWVGRNARQNEEVTFKRAGPEDRWLHVRGMPGSHVIIRNAGRPVDPATVEMAAQLAAYYSKARGERAAEVSMTERRFVRRLPGGRTGQVTIRNVETVVVPAELPKP